MPQPDVQPLYMSTKHAAIITGLSHDTVARKFSDPALLRRIEASLPADHLPLVVNHAADGERPTEAMTGSGRKRKLITRRTRTALRIHVDAVEAYLRLVAVVPAA